MYFGNAGKVDFIRIFTVFIFVQTPLPKTSVFGNGVLTLIDRISL